MGMPCFLLSFLQVFCSRSENQRHGKIWICNRVPSFYTNQIEEGRSIVLLSPMYIWGGLASAVPGVPSQSRHSTRVRSARLLPRERTVSSNPRLNMASLPDFAQICNDM